MPQNVCPTHYLGHKTLGDGTIILGRREYKALYIAARGPVTIE